MCNGGGYLNLVPPILMAAQPDSKLQKSSPAERGGLGAKDMDASVEVTFNS